MIISINLSIKYFSLLLIFLVFVYLSFELIKVFTISFKLSS